MSSPLFFAIFLVAIPFRIASTGVFLVLLANPVFVSTFSNILLDLCTRSFSLFFPLGDQRIGRFLLAEACCLIFLSIAMLLPKT